MRASAARNDAAPHVDVQLTQRLPASVRKPRHAYRRIFGLKHTSARSPMLFDRAVDQVSALYDAFGGKAVEQLGYRALNGAFFFSCR